MKPSLRIALIIPSGVDRRDKAKLVPTLLWLIERLAHRHVLHVFALSQYARPAIYSLFGATIHNLAEENDPSHERQVYSLKRWVLWRKIMEVARKKGPWDLVHAFWGGTSGWLAVMEAHRLDVPSVVSLAGDELVALPDIQYGAQLDYSARREVSETLKLATRLTVGTTYMQRILQGHGYKSDIVPLGLDQASFSPKRHVFSSPRSPSRATPWRLLHVATLHPVNDQSTLLHAFRAVVDQISNVQLDIIGQDRLRGAVQAQSAQLGLTQHVTFHRYLRSSSMQYFFEKADLFVFPARHAAGPVAVLEAAARRLPTVGTNVGYVADWAGTRAIAVSVGDAEALAGAIIALLQHPRQRQTLARAAYQWVRTYDADWTANQFQSIYRALIDQFTNN